jgi:hypothetical protein
MSDGCETVRRLLPQGYSHSWLYECECEKLWVRALPPKHSPSVSHDSRSAEYTCAHKDRVTESFRIRAQCLEGVARCHVSYV